MLCKRLQKSGEQFHEIVVDIWRGRLIFAEAVAIAHYLSEVDCGNAERVSADGLGGSGDHGGELEFSEERNENSGKCASTRIIRRRHGGARILQRGARQ
jgi:hypothetical protein